MLKKRVEFTQYKITKKETGESITISALSVESALIITGWREKDDNDLKKIKAACDVEELGKTFSEY